MASEAWLKRQALSICAQLPENSDDALKVLAYSVDIVNRFMAPGKMPPKAARKAQGALLSLVGSSASPRA
jgi:hypothetical protein